MNRKSKEFNIGIIGKVGNIKCFIRKLVINFFQMPHRRFHFLCKNKCRICLTSTINLNVL